MMTEEGRLFLDKCRLDSGLDPTLPWGGRSPRVLTRAHERFRLKPSGDAATDFGDDRFIDEQCRRHQYGS